MVEIILILFCISVASSTNLLDIGGSLFSTNYDVPIRVRTLEQTKNINNSVLDFVGLVEQYDGYTAQEFNVTSEDGYILKLHRVSTTPILEEIRKPVIYLQHGLFASSDFWVTSGMENSFALVLAEAGYDVWVGNVRGNSYSRAHVSCLPTDNSCGFWNFGLDEIGNYDVSANIDFILNKTGQKNVTFIGYSMGATVGYILLCSKPEYNEKIKLFISVAPSVYFTKPPYTFLETSLTILINLAKFRGNHEILPISVEMIKYAKESCNSTTTINTCKLTIEPVGNTEKINFTRMANSFGYTPAGASLRTLQQFLQLSQSKGLFHRYNENCDFWLCDSKSLEYNMSLVIAPNVLIFSENDVLAKPEDIEFLKSKLRNVVASVKISEPKFNHLDFIFSTLSNKLVNDEVLKIIGLN